MKSLTIKILSILLSIVILFSSTIVHAENNDEIHYDEIVAGSDIKVTDFQFEYIMGGTGNTDAAYAYYAVNNQEQIEKIFDLTPTEVMADPLGWLFSIDSYTVIRYSIKTDEIDVFFNVPNIQQIILNNGLQEIEQGYDGLPYIPENTERFIKTGKNSDSPESAMTRYGFNIPSYVYGGEYPIIYMDADGILPSDLRLAQAAAQALVPEFLSSMFGSPQAALRAVGTTLIGVGVVLLVANPILGGLVIAAGVISWILGANDALNVNIASPPTEKNYNSMKYMNNDYGKLNHQRLYNFIKQYWQKYIINNLVYRSDEELSNFIQYYKKYQEAAGGLTAKEFEKQKEELNKSIDEAIKYIQNAENPEKGEHKDYLAWKKTTLWNNWKSVEHLFEEVGTIDLVTEQFDFYEKAKQEANQKIRECEQELEICNAEYSELYPAYEREVAEWLERAKEGEIDPRTTPKPEKSARLIYLENEKLRLSRLISGYEKNILHYDAKIEYFQYYVELYNSLGFDLSEKPSEPTEYDTERSERYAEKYQLANTDKLEMGFKELQELIYKDAGNDDASKGTVQKSATEKGYNQLTRNLWEEEHEEDAEEWESITMFELLFSEKSSLYAFCRGVADGIIPLMTVDDINYPYVILNAIEKFCDYDDVKYSAILNSIISVVIESADKKGETIIYSDVNTKRIMPYDITTLSEKERQILGVVDPRVEIYKNSLIGGITTAGKINTDKLLNLKIPEKLVSITGIISELTVFLNGIITLETFDELGISPVDLWQHSLLRVIFLVLIGYVLLKILQGLFKYIRAKSISLSFIFSKIAMLLLVGTIFTVFMINPNGVWNTTKGVIGLIGNVGERIIATSDNVLLDLRGDDKDNDSINYWITYFDVWTYYNTGHNLLDKANRVPQVKGGLITPNTPGAEGMTWLHDIDTNDSSGEILPVIGNVIQKSWSTMLAEGFLKTNPNKVQIDERVYRVVDNFLAPIVRTDMLLKEDTNALTNLGFGKFSDTWGNRYKWSSSASVDEEIKNTAFGIKVWSNPNYNGQFQGSFPVNKLLNVILLFIIVLVKLLTFIYFWYKLYSYIFSILLSINGNMDIGGITKETFLPLLQVFAISIWGTIVFYISLQTTGIGGIALSLFLYWASWKLFKFWNTTSSFPPTLKILSIFIRKKKKSNNITALAPTSTIDVYSAQPKLTPLHISDIATDAIIESDIRRNICDANYKDLGHLVTNISSLPKTLLKHSITVELDGKTHITMEVEVVEYSIWKSVYYDELNTWDKGVMTV